MNNTNGNTLLTRVKIEYVLSKPETPQKRETAILYKYEIDSNNKCNNKFQHSFFIKLVKQSSKSTTRSTARVC